MAETTHVLIIGSGVAGATIAAGLLDRGIGPIVMLEAGPRVAMRRNRSWLDFLTTGATPYDRCGDDAGDTNAPEWLLQSRLFARGGSTLHWGGWALRLKPEDFARYTSSGSGADWPLAYADLEPWYTRTEQFFGVAGDSADRAVPRSAPLPFPALPYTQVDGEVINGFTALGYGYSPMPIARNVAPRDGWPACQTIGTCKYCPLGARFTADQTLDRLESQAGFTLYTDAAVTAIRMDRPDRAAGVDYLHTTSGEQRRIEADVVIVCAGALETPKLLLNSANSYWPDGIGNANGHVGRHLSYHALLYARGWQTVNPRRLQQELDFPTLCSRHFDTPDEQRAGKLFMFLPAIKPRVDLAGLMKSGESAETIGHAVTGPYEVELQGFMELPPAPDARVVPGTARNRFGLFSTDVRFQQTSAAEAQLQLNLARMAKALTAAGYGNLRTGVFPPRGDHAAGTCRMARSDTDGVVDENLRVHGTGNVYVCSNAVFPSGGAVNPTLTLTALGMRLAGTIEPAS